MTAAEIAETLSMPLSTVSAVLRRSGLGRLGRIGLEPAGPLRALAAGRARPHRRQEARPDRRRRRQARRRDRTAPARRPRTRRRTADVAAPTGWEYVHVAVDDYSRLAYAEVLGDEKAATAAGFLRRALAFYRRTASRSSASSPTTAAATPTVHALACRTLGIRHLRTRPYRPQTNGKAERFIRTMLNGWAYGAIYRSSHERTPALDGWLWHYNHRRRHSALGHQPPISRTNLLGSYS